MKNIKTYIYIFIGLIILVIGYLFVGPTQPSQAFAKISPELRLSMLSEFGKFKGKVVAASCGFSTAGHSASDSTPCTLTVNCCYGNPVSGSGRSLCGGTCQANTPSPFPICQNHPSIGQPCTSAPNACGVTVSGTYDSCGICSGNPPTVASCSLTNVCGQTFSGNQCPTGCTASNGSTDPNSTCITDFKVSTDNVNPNGSVEFSWKIAQVPGIGSRCGFVDLTTPTPRPIPGLQNLDPSTDRIRISNIQTTTRFCLVCQFFNLTSNNILGDAAVHQWIRVIRIGEN